MEKKLKDEYKKKPRFGEYPKYTDKEWKVSFSESKCGTNDHKRHRRGHRGGKKHRKYNNW